MAELDDHFGLGCRRWQGVAAGFGSSFWPQAESAKAAATERATIRKAWLASVFLLISEG
jgi:hypothetical protein